MQDLPQGLSTTGLTNGTSLNLNSLGIDTGFITTVMTVGTIVSIILTVIILIYFIINIAHRWRSEKAMVEMGKDIREIKVLLEKQVAGQPPAAEPYAQSVEQSTQPTE